MGLADLGDRRIVGRSVVDTERDDADAARLDAARLEVGAARLAGRDDEGRLVTGDGEAATHHAQALACEVLGCADERQVVDRDDERGVGGGHGTRPVAWATSTGPVACSTRGRRRRSHASYRSGRGKGSWATGIDGRHGVAGGAR